MKPTYIISYRTDGSGSDVSTATVSASEHATFVWSDTLAKDFQSSSSLVPQTSYLPPLLSVAYKGVYYTFATYPNVCTSEKALHVSVKTFPRYFCVFSRNSGVSISSF